MGFLMSEWDEKLLKYGELFETKLWDLRVNISLDEALDLGWNILAACFEPNETGLKTNLIQERWPKELTKIEVWKTMASVKLTKNELKKQKDQLKQFERYLPTLQLKKQQLQMVIMKTVNELEQMDEAYHSMIDALDDWVAVFAENTVFPDDKKIEKLVIPDNVIYTQDNIAGVSVPVFKELTFQEISYDVADYPLWVDEALVQMREISRKNVLLLTMKEQVELLNRELRLTSQRVNLFEKVKIPEAKENIRKIEIYLGDQQTSAVVRGKIAKKKRQGAGV